MAEKKDILDTNQAKAARYKGPGISSVIFVDSRGVASEVYTVGNLPDLGPTSALEAIQRGLKAQPDKKDTST